MSRQFIAIRKQERMKTLAKIMYSALDSGDRRVLVKQIFYMLPAALRFKKQCELHYFLKTLPLTIEGQGQGRGKRTILRIDARGLSFIADKLDMKLIDLLKLSNPKQREHAAFMSVGDFHQMHDDIPEFAPMGDPVFNLTKAPTL
ncbi:MULTISPECIES: hypothetical protein [unclassified Pseudodesulfovibrio]|uniref:hypothetical protein n=1 Tax=unclassified Pseudodesulfovibrio TaxID=2661612 RepID=UPI000FEBEFC2|nr:MULTISPECIES: hypothetical protein [unclassified Pseudodesulfovibrio]MCJ2164633.1 hypothetical protein [Pseudodesulfovibrio sp. S3-i]RWU04173.1 hypothetical protein DWB63_09200 [Pseudodesulfovibrio sp. S3]